MKLNISIYYYWKNGLNNNYLFIHLKKLKLLIYAHKIYFCIIIYFRHSFRNFFNLKHYFSLKSSENKNNSLLSDYNFSTLLHSFIS